MGDKTGISWTDATWNPIRGCSRVSAGCMNCYAERVATRFSGPGQPYEGLVTVKSRHPETGRATTGTRGKWNGSVKLIAGHLADPLRWKKPRRIFVNSMSDLFHEALTNEQIAAVFGVMAAAPRHTFQVLTKRAKRMREWFEWLHTEGFHDHAADTMVEGIAFGLAFEAADGLGDGTDGDRDRWYDRLLDLFPTTAPPKRSLPWPLPNVWLGVSVENQAAADERIPELLATPAAIRFLSCEPLLGPLDLTGVRNDRGATVGTGGLAPRLMATTDGEMYERPGLDWVIAGCESGPGARRCDVEWLRSLRDQCDGAQVPFFLKQAAGDVERCDQGCGQRVTYRRLSVDLADASCGCTVEGAESCDPNGVMEGEGSKRKGGNVIELPYLDGVQHAAFPRSP